MSGQRDLPQEILQVRNAAERVFSPEQIAAAVKTMAGRIAARIGDRNPLLLGVMVGGVVPLGLLLTHLDFPLEVDYIHATRYRGATRGGVLHWLRDTPASVAGRCVLVVDDVLDEGHTLAAIRDQLLGRGAAEVLTAVLVEKRLPRQDSIPHADFAALECEDRYLFGYGMDYRGYLRNAPGVFAVASQ
ncbi:MAG: hypoxanthine-guanine phosphoribosyltransferase [Gammaproteobacteria bacterium]